MTTVESLTLLDHLRELRERILVSALAILMGTIACYAVYDKIVVILMKPFLNLHGSPTTLYVNSLFEGFATKMHFSIVAGVILTLPVHLYGLIRFVLPGLSSSEKRVLGWALFASLVLSVFSVYMGYFYFIPAAVEILTGSDFVPTGVGVLLNFNQALFYVMNFMLYSMLTFQLPIVLEILLYLNIISRRTLLRQSRFVIVVIFIIAAIVTPTPDVVNQLFIAVPLLLFYFATLALAYVFKFGEG